DPNTLSQSQRSRYTESWSHPPASSRAPEDVVSDPQTLIENRPPSVANLFLERVEATPDGEAYRHPVPPASGQGPDEWRSYTWGEAAKKVFATAAGLMDLGVRPEERVAIASNTRVE